MATSRTTKVVSLNPSGITVLPERCRQIRPATVTALAESMAAQGLINPIVVRSRPRKGIGYVLIAGWHRLMAARELKWPDIRATVLDGIEADEAELIEIDENLIRANLDDAEEAMHVDRRKTLYEAVYPETKRGAAGGAATKAKAKGKAKGQNDAQPAFIDDTAKKTGKSRRTVGRAAKRGKVGRAWLKEIAGTCLAKKTEIDALIELEKLSKGAFKQLIKAAKAHKADPKKQKRVSARIELKKTKREQRERELGAKQLALPAKKYGVIVTDDAWDFEVWSRETGMDRHAANHYTVEDAHTAAELHKATCDRFNCAAKDCLLAMWTTVPHLAIAVDLLRLRGFKYVSHYVWGKDKSGTGYWNRNRHEILLLGVKGDIPCPAPGEQWDSLQMAPVGKSGEKPEIFLQMLEEYFPTLPKIEFNRRGPPRPGWDAWGNEAEEPAKEAAE
jgi:N6-adenosine-specific RNA methylase IME4